jgi:hypothetical protein
MYLHENEEDFIELIDEINTKYDIDTDILEKDYYVCLVLQELAKNQDDLKAYFKGGTAVYKILDTMNRFSEDIDLTVKVVEADSKTSNSNRLKKSASGYNIIGLELQQDKTERIGDKAITAFYKYDTLFKEKKNLLHRAGEVQVEATSFTISEPTEKSKVEPLIYKHATDEQKKVLKEKFNLSEFEVETLTIERIFTDKLFAIETYYRKQDYSNLSKHLYDITILFRLDKIQKLFDDKANFEEILKIQKLEETFRRGGIENNTEIKDFSYFSMEFTEEITKAFKFMQDKYIYNDEYRIDTEKVKDTLKEIKQKMEV